MEIDSRPRHDKPRKAVKLAALGLLAARNRRSAPVTGDAPVVLSMTSYGRRLGVVGYAIESLAAGRARPARLLLWVDDPEAVRAAHPMIDRLARRGLEVLATEDFGPHKKSYPYCRLVGGTGMDLVTADDDLLYPRGWLAGLLAAQAAYPGDFVGYRAKEVTLHGQGELAPYAQWPAAPAGASGPRVFLTSGAGVVFPSALRAALADAGEAFMDVCPRADDIWINACALRAGVTTRTVDARGMSMLSIPRSQGEQALHTDNVGGGGNDRQLAATLTPADIEILRKG